MRGLEVRLLSPAPPDHGPYRTQSLAGQPATMSHSSASQRSFYNRDTVQVALLGMVTGEVLAHLNCLIGRGRARRRTTAEGVWLYEPA